MPLGVPYVFAVCPPAFRAAAQHLGRGRAGSPSPLDYDIPPTHPSPSASLLPSPRCRGRVWDAEEYLEEGLLVMDGEGWDPAPLPSPPNPPLPSPQVSPAVPASPRRS